MVAFPLQNAPLAVFGDVKVKLKVKQNWQLGILFQALKLQLNGTTTLTVMSY